MKLKVVFALSLGLIHRCVGRVQQSVSLLTILRVDGRAHAAADANGVWINEKWLADRVRDSLCNAVDLYRHHLFKGAIQIQAGTPLHSWAVQPILPQGTDSFH
ncbi:hypothetical protein GGC63_002965 [Paenibacillus sp. OAS669]|nr:hypothetical protein [Paenibacillus sp. OAS669]MBE1443515.1 hypothetical protein [Paenibacillus sp. OAS669]